MGTHLPSQAKEACQANGTTETLSLVQWLSGGTLFGARAEQVSVVETHISWVFLTETRAYKLKKPVRYDFLDFTTLEARRRACEDEVQLNRRLATSVYLGVVAVTQNPDGCFELGGTGEPVDWLVMMRRLREFDALDSRIRSATVSADEVERVVALLGNFYRDAQRISLTPELYSERLEKHVRANHAQLLDSQAELVRTHIQRAHAAQLQVLQLRPELLAARVAGHWILDGHGDLRPEHVFLEDPPQIIDCIEFDPEYRQLDVADELSFLAMECERVAAYELGDRIMRDCLEMLGDRPPPAMIAFYKSYRACVRAKVKMLRTNQLAGPARDAKLIQARDYLRLADGYASRFRPLLIVIGGLMGTGKSTLARELGGLFAAELLQTDALRREVQGPSEHPANYGEGPYRTENRAAMYNELFRRAAHLLSEGLSVVLDGTFLAGSLIYRAYELAQQHRATFLHVRCICPREVSVHRIANRRRRDLDPSEARPEFYDQQKQEQESPPANVSVQEVDSQQPLQQQAAAVQSTLAGLLRLSSEN